MTERVRGYCPMGCGQTLRLNSAGVIVCLVSGCSRPTAVSDLLLMREVIEHRVTLTPDDFQIVHPLRERFGDEIGRCQADQYLLSFAGPPVPPGVYQLGLQSDGSWMLTLWTD